MTAQQDFSKFFADLDDVVARPRQPSVNDSYAGFFEDLDELESKPSQRLDSTTEADYGSFFADLDQPQQVLDRIPAEQPEQLELPEEKPSFFQRLGKTAAMGLQSGGFAGAPSLTPESAELIKRQSPKILEGATAGFYQAPEYEDESEGEKVLGEALRLYGETGLIGASSKFLKFLGIQPKTWYGKVLKSTGIGAGLSAAKQQAYEGEVDVKEVAKDAAIWGGIDLGLEAINGAMQFKQAVEYISNATGKPKDEVLGFFKRRFMDKFRGVPPAEPEVMAKEALEIAEQEAQTVAETPKPLDEAVQSKVISSSEIPEEDLTIQDRMRNFETQFINQFAPLDRLVEEGAETFENPAKLAELVDGAAGQTKQALDHGQFDIETLETTGPGLRQIFEPRAILKVEGKKKLNRKAFRAYLAARSSLDRARLGQKTAISVDEAKAYLDKHKRYESLAQEYTKFLNQNLTNLRKSGMISPKAEKGMREMYLNYAPLYRVVEKPPFMGRRTRTLQPEKLPKKAKGSARTIIDPMESAIRNTAATYRAIAKNRVMNAIRNQLEPMGYKVKSAPKPDYGKLQLEGLMGEELGDKAANQLAEIKGILDPESYAPGNGKIFGYRDGQRWEMEAPQEVIDAVKALNPAQSSFVLGLANKWRSIFSGGVVLQPGTMLRISGMDIVVSTLQSKYPQFPVLDLPLNVFYHFPRMLLETVRKGDLYQDYLKSGAAQFALQGLDREQIESMITDLTNSERIQEYGLTDLAKDSVKLPWTAIKGAWKGLGKVSEKLGDATRLIEFEKSYQNAIDRGLDRSQALAQAAHDAFEVSIPYGRQGASSALQEMYKIVPFMRTVVNSNITFAEAMDPRNPNFMKFLSTALAALTLPTLYFYAKNRNDERYQRIPQEDRDRNIYIYTSDDPNEEPIRLRKLWQYGFVFQTLPERVMEFIAQKDPKAFEKLAKNLEYEFSPFQFLSVSSALEDGFHPEKLFEGTRFQVIPEKQKRIDATLQHTQSTTDLAKKLGALTKISPIYIDFIIGNTGGGLGQNIARLFDEVEYFTGAIEERRPEAKHADNALWGTFFARGPTKRSEHLNRFYDLHDKMQIIKSTVRQLEKEGQFDKAKKYSKEHPFVETEWMRRRIGVYYKKIDEVLALSAPTETERKRKRLELDQLYIDLSNEAKAYEKKIVSDLAHQKKQ